jgi:hypothetical protein
MTYNLIFKNHIFQKWLKRQKSGIGLQADARVVMVFASPFGQFYYNLTNPAHLSGPRHLDNFVMTPTARPSTGTLQKRMPTLTQTATPHTTWPLCASCDSIR